MSYADKPSGSPVAPYARKDRDNLQGPGQWQFRIPLAVIAAGGSELEHGGEYSSINGLAHETA